MITAVSDPEEVRAAALAGLRAADDPGTPDRYERMLAALHDLHWRPQHAEIAPGYMRWCEWPDCLRSYNVLTGPNRATDGEGWIYVRTGTHILLCPDHADTGHRPQRPEWTPGQTTINTSCQCGDRGDHLTPTSYERCIRWWRDHVRQATPAPQTKPVLKPALVEVLTHLASGSTRREIARDLGLTESGIGRRLTQIHAALGTRTSSQAVHTATVLGLLRGAL
jgi:DNA-binding CsgD family transcriptional regulator